MLFQDAIHDIKCAISKFIKLKKEVICGQSLNCRKYFISKVFCQIWKGFMDGSIQ